jgi:hypothetical protein
VARAFEESTKATLSAIELAQKQGIEIARAVTTLQLSMLAAVTGADIESAQRIADRRYDASESAIDTMEEGAREMVVATTRATAETTGRLTEAYGGVVDSTFDSFLISYEGETGTRPTAIRLEE